MIRLIFVVFHRFDIGFQIWVIDDGILMMVRIVVLRSLGGLMTVTYNVERKGNKKSFSLSLARSSILPQITCDCSLSS